MQVWVEEPENVPYYAKTVSTFFPGGSILGLSCQSVADAIGYWKFADGLEKRVLEYGFCRERTWEKVVGDPEAWEQAVFEGREGYVPGQNPVVGKTLSHFSNFDLQKVGEMLELPGFGTPAPGESWTKQEVS